MNKSFWALLAVPSITHYVWQLAKLYSRATLSDALLGINWCNLIEISAGLIGIPYYFFRVDFFRRVNGCVNLITIYELSDDNVYIRLVQVDWEFN